MKYILRSAMLLLILTNSVLARDENECKIARDTASLLCNDSLKTDGALAACAGAQINILIYCS